MELSRAGSSYLISLVRWESAWIVCCLAVGVGLGNVTTPHPYHRTLNLLLNFENFIEIKFRIGRRENTYMNRV